MTPMDESFVRTVTLEELATQDPDAHASWMRCEEVQPISTLARARGMEPVAPQFSKPTEVGGWVLTGPLGDRFVLGYDPLQKIWTFMEYETDEVVNRIYGYEARTKVR